MLEQGHGHGRSASRWIATATSVEPHWSPAAGSSLQLTASRTQTPSSEKDTWIMTIINVGIVFRYVMSADIQMLVRGGPTWECVRWLRGITEHPRGRSAGSSSTHSMTSSPLTMTSPFSSSVLLSSSMNWCSLCASLRPHTLSQQGPAATSQAGGSSWRTVRNVKCHLMKMKS